MQDIEYLKNHIQYIDKEALEKATKYGRTLSYYDIFRILDNYYKKTNPKYAKKCKENVEEYCDIKIIRAVMRRISSIYHPDLFVDEKQKQENGEIMAVLNGISSEMEKNKEKIDDDLRYIRMREQNEIKHNMTEEERRKNEEEKEKVRKANAESYRKEHTISYMRNDGEKITIVEEPNRIFERKPQDWFFTTFYEYKVRTEYEGMKIDFELYSERDYIEDMKRNPRIAFAGAFSKENILHSLRANQGLLIQDGDMQDKELKHRRTYFGGGRRKLTEIGEASYGNETFKLYRIGGGDYHKRIVIAGEIDFYKMQEDQMYKKAVWNKLLDVERIKKYQIMNGVSFVGDLIEENGEIEPYIPYDVAPWLIKMKEKQMMQKERENE